MLHRGGVVVTVVQLSNDTLPDITPTEYAKLNMLSSVMNLVAADKLERIFRVRKVFD